MEKFSNFDALFSRLRADKEVPVEKKAEMTEAYFDIYQEKVHTTTQSSDELKRHLDQLEKIKIEKEYYRGLLLEQKITTPNRDYTKLCDSCLDRKECTWQACEFYRKA